MREILHITLDIDPATISTAQQKRFDPRSRRFFTNGKVLQGMRLILSLASPYASAVRSMISEADGVELGMAFLYAYPKSTPRERRIDLIPLPSGADSDNRAKAPIDALALAGWWSDDRIITRHVLAKLRTTGIPRIEIAVAPAMRRNAVSDFLF